MRESLFQLELEIEKSIEHKSISRFFHTRTIIQLGLSFKFRLIFA